MLVPDQGATPDLILACGGSDEPNADPRDQGTAGSPMQPRNAAPKGVSPTSVTAAPRCEVG